MNRKTASVLIAATVGIAAGLTVSHHAYADDITMDTPFTSTKSRDEVRAELKKPFASGNPWSTLYRQGVAKDSSYTRQQARAEYLGSRDELRALYGEDSGANYQARIARRADSTATMGAPAR